VTAHEVFQFDGDTVRTVLIDGEPWFVATDVAEALGFRDAHNAIRGLDEDEQGTHNVSTPGGDQAVAIVNEPGIYSLIFRSRKPEAKAFKRWIAHEVLPTLRRQGFYGMHPELTVYSFDEAATLIEQRTGLSLTVSLMVKLMKAAGVLKQNGAPATKYKHLFWHTGLTYMVWPHELPKLTNKVWETHHQLREFRSMQTRLEAEGFGQLQLPAE
jgi:prophage antirepressor-like protein